MLQQQQAVKKKRQSLKLDSKGTVQRPTQAAELWGRNGRDSFRTGLDEDAYHNGTRQQNADDTFQFPVNEGAPVARSRSASRAGREVGLASLHTSALEATGSGEMKKVRKGKKSLRGSSTERVRKSFGALPRPASGVSIYLSSEL